MSYSIVEACVCVEVVIRKVAKYSSPSLFAYFKRFYFKLFCLVYRQLDLKKKKNPKQTKS